MFRALVDNGSDINLVNQALVVQYDIPTLEVPLPRARTLNNQEMKIYSAVDFKLACADDNGVVGQTLQRFYGTSFSPYDLVLGIPWLLATDPDISYASNSLRWRGSPTEEPIAYVSAVELLAELGPEDRAWVCYPKECLTHSFDDLGPTEVRRVAAVDTTPVVLPEEFREEEDIFSEERSNELAPRTDYNYTINLKEGKVPLYLPIYNIL